MYVSTPRDGGGMSLFWSAPPVSGLLFWLGPGIFPNPAPPDPGARSFLQNWRSRAVLEKSPHDQGSPPRHGVLVVAVGCGRRSFLQPRAREKSGAGPWGPLSVATSTNPRFRFHR